MKITIGKRSLKDGRRSLYLSFMEKGVRRRKALGIVLDRPDAPEIRRCNRLKMELARKIRAKCELESMFSVYGLPPIGLDAPFLLSAFAAYVKDYPARDVAVLKAVGNYLRSFPGSRDLPVCRVDVAFCKAFRDYLAAHLTGTTPGNYFKKFKAFIRHCHCNGLLRDDPSAECKAVVDDSLAKAVLTFGELDALAAAPCPVDDVKRAFLFACNTGLRWCDVKNLRVCHVDAASRELLLVQQKVERTSRRSKLRISLNDNAFSLIRPALGHPSSEPLFSLPSYNYMLRLLARWVKAAGVDKHITFHCARHTFITNLIAQGTHLSIAASLAGHSSTRHTEKYVHIADEQRREAVNRLPRLALGTAAAERREERS